MDVTIRREPLTPELVAELRPLIADHQAEVPAEHVNPDWLQLHRLDRGDAMAVVVARIGGAPVGYVAHIANRNHLTGEVWATCVALYLAPAHRRLALHLVRHAEGLARRAGAAAVAYHAPMGSGAGRFLEGVGYRPLEVVQVKRL